MHWVIQNHFFSQVYFDTLCRQLESYGISYSCVQVSASLLQIKPEIESQESLIIVMGSSSLGKIAKQRKWTPGYFDNNLDYRLYMQHYGSDMLNEQAVIAPLGQLQPAWEKFFIRPVSDKKTFSGTVMNCAEFSDMQQHAATDIGQQPSAVAFDQNDIVVIAPLQTIYAEYRFWVVDARIVTSSRYRLGKKGMFSSDVDERITAFAQKQIDKWQPDRAFVIDIADTEDGLKVIEINAINSSALYAANAGKLINAIEAMSF